MNLKKDLVKVLGANFIQFLIGVVNGFLIPAVLEIDQYAYLKTFTLYTSYVGVLHFGFNDGIYLKYGGRKRHEIDLSSLKYERNFLLKFQLVVTLIFIVLGVLKKDFIIISFALTIVPSNLRTFFDFLYQAMGEFSVYSKIAVIYPISLLTFNLIIIFVLNSKSYIPFVISYLIALYLPYLVYEIEYNRSFKINNVAVGKDFSEIKMLFKIGIFIMLGNLSTLLVYSLDRWFVKLWLTIEDFAFYSFAVSLMSVINLVISSVAMTFYPYLSRGYTESLLNKLKSYLIIVGSISSTSYFIIGLIVKVFLFKYVKSLDIISILFASFPATAIISVLYTNLYKVNKLERKYFRTVVTILIISFTLNTIALSIGHNSQSIALATTITFYIWLFYSLKDFRDLRFHQKEFLFLVVYLSLFFICTLVLGFMEGFVTLGAGIFLLTITIYKKEFIELIGEIFK
jgi:O-antigen/teichoic acid export membrane protein